MRFWLKWAIVTLPLAACLFLWARSFLHQEDLYREGYHNEFSLGSSRGALFVAFLRAADWNITGGHWSFHSSHDSEDLDDPYGYVRFNKFPGFGYFFGAGPAGGSETLIQLPMWAIALLLIIPPLWIYRRQRKHRKIGFPVEPVATSSTRSTQAQTD